MFTLVIGGAASGKSEYAEAHVETLPGRRLYIATMEPWDEECRARIAATRQPGAQTVYHSGMLSESLPAYCSPG